MASIPRPVIFWIISIGTPSFIFFAIIYQKYWFPIIMVKLTNFKPKVEGMELRGICTLAIKFVIFYTLFTQDL